MSVKLHPACMIALCLCLGACESLAPTKPVAVTTAALPAKSPLDGYVQMLAALSGQDRVRQSDVFYQVEKDQTLAPTTLNVLSYAMALVIPGHPNSDPIKGKRLLEEVLTNPERISVAEQSLAVTMLNIADQWLKMQAEMRRLAATVDDRTRTQSNSDRRSLAQAEEINKLRKALDAAQQKLDAIRDIEKSISERSTTPSGTRDSGNREPTTQTQTPPAGR
jgi:Skp family chaperone for outer membrane proteins